VATHTATQVDWENLLRSMPGQAGTGGLRRADAISNAWRRSGRGPSSRGVCTICTRNIRKEIKKYAQTGYGSTGMMLLNDTFKTLAGWRASYPWVAP